MSAKKQIEHNLYKIKEKNVKIKVIDGLEMIYYPDNIGKDDYIYNYLYICIDLVTIK